MKAPIYDSESQSPWLFHSPMHRLSRSYVRSRRDAISRDPQPRRTIALSSRLIMTSADSSLRQAKGGALEPTPAPESTTISRGETLQQGSSDERVGRSYVFMSSSSGRLGRVVKGLVRVMIDSLPAAPLQCNCDRYPLVLAYHSFWSFSHGTGVGRRDDRPGPHVESRDATG
jgi:hypothetical protein